MIDSITNESFFMVLMINIRYSIKVSIDPKIFNEEFNLLN